MAIWRQHWNPTYLRDRLTVMRWEKANPDKPWLVRAAVESLDDLIRPGDVMAEFGSGRSTKWFCSKVSPAGKVISTEDYQPWYEKVKADLAGLSNVEYLFGGQTPEEYLAPATAAVARIGGRIDVALIDGFKHRDHAALWALDRVKPGGMVIINNVNRYLPHATRSPASLAPGKAGMTPLWEQYAARTRSWRYEWFSSGVTDTAIWFVPADHRPGA
jgi:hypothetical protein